MLVRRAMAERAEPILYSFRRCPYAMRARLGIAISGQRVELREILLSAKPEAMLAASPKGTVPVLVLPDGQVLEQSLDILRWALARHDPEGWLALDDEALIAANDGQFKQALDRYKYPSRHGLAPEPHRAAGMEFLAELDRRLAENGQLCGKRRGLADMAIMPFVRQFSAVEPEWFASLPLPHVQKWLAGHLASDLFAQIMVRPAPWRPGDNPILFPAA